MKKKEKKQKKLISRMIGFLTNLLLMVAVGLFVLNYLMYYVHQDGYSMDATIRQGGSVFINRLWYAIEEPQRYDIVAYQSGSKVQVRRIVGMPNETVEIRDGVLYINDLPMDENHVYTDTIEIAGLASKKITLAPDEYFVLGDNPDRSQDSRFADTGNVSEEQILGRAWLTVSSIVDVRLIWDTERVE
ncbi:MAG: signal peptidase I [Lachnospiraceae bacterium]|nr:signal peptidase I [Lachnospiraceae bacterium]